MSDYGVPVPPQLVFALRVSSLCTDIATTDDAVYEENESLNLFLSSTNENVDITGNLATILIIDNDGISEITVFECKHFLVQHCPKGVLCLQVLLSDSCSQTILLKREKLLEYAPTSLEPLKLLSL